MDISSPQDNESLKPAAVGKKIDYQKPIGVLTFGHVVGILIKHESRGRPTTAFNFERQRQCRWNWLIMMRNRSSVIARRACMKIVTENNAPRLHINAQKTACIAKPATSGPDAEYRLDHLRALAVRITAGCNSSPAGREAQHGILSPGSCALACGEPQNQGLNVLIRHRQFWCFCRWPGCRLQRRRRCICPRRAWMNSTGLTAAVVFA